MIWGSTGNGARYLGHLGCSSSRCISPLLEGPRIPTPNLLGFLPWIYPCPLIISIYIYIHIHTYIYFLIDPQYIIISTVSLVVYPYCNSCCLSKIFASKSASCWVAIGLSDSQLLQLLGVFCAIVCTDKFVNLQDLLFLTQSGVTLVRMNRLPIFHQKWGRAPSLACIVLFEVHMLYDHQLFFKLDGTSCCLEFW